MINVILCNTKGIYGGIDRCFNSNTGYYIGITEYYYSLLCITTSPICSRLMEFFEPRITYYVLPTYTTLLHYYTTTLNHIHNNQNARNNIV